MIRLSDGEITTTISLGILTLYQGVPDRLTGGWNCQCCTLHSWLMRCVQMSYKNSLWMCKYP